MLDSVAKPSDLDVSGLRVYRGKEDAYVRLLQDICNEFRKDQLIVANPVILKPPEPYLGEFRNGSLVSLGVASRLVRSMLRGGGSFGCALVVPDSNLRISVGPGDSILIEAEDELLALVRSKLPASLSVTGQVELSDEYISAPVNDEFWDVVTRDGVDRGKPVWIQERWAQGKYGERWFLADSSTIRDVGRAVYSNSAICAGAVDVPMEEIALAEIFDEVTADSADELDLLVLSEYMNSGPDLGALPLDSRLLMSESISVNDPVRVIYPGKFRVGSQLELGERLWEGVTPDPDGRLWARWLGLAPPTPRTLGVCSVPGRVGPGVPFLSLSLFPR
jgi:hypothetical protein